MPISKYAEINVLSQDVLVVNSLMKICHELILIGEKKTGKTNILNESYARIGNLLPLEGVNEPYAPVGSSWALQCFENHGFHTHVFSDDDKMLSKRRVLFFADKGFSVELFSTINKDSQLEMHLFKGTHFTEIEFDGRLVHRFRPLSGGLLYAYSIHYKEIDKSLKAAETQTIEFAENIPKNTQLFEYQ